MTRSTGSPSSATRERPPAHPRPEPASRTPTTTPDTSPARVANTGTTTWHYDAQGRSDQKVLPGSVTSTAGYDGVGNVTSYTDPGGTVTYRYDGANHLTAVAEPGGSCPASPTVPNSTRCTIFGYDTSGRRTSTGYPSGQTIAVTYDSSNRPTKISETQSSGTVIHSRQYTYTKAGADTGVAQSVADEAGVGYTYPYDGMNRLTKATGTGGATTTTWTYDLAGNRCSQVRGSTTTSYAYNGADELCWSVPTSSAAACASPPTGSTTYTWDGNGNLTAAGLTAYTYNAKNQTTAVGPTSFTYADADSTERTAGSTTFANGLLGLSQQTTGGATTSFTREPGSGALISMRVGSSSYYYNTDAIGSTFAVTDASVGSAASYSYEAYGDPSTSSGAQAGANPFRFAGGYSDASGLVTYRTRYYAPTLGRWTQRDAVSGTINNPGTVNRYPYASNNPVNQIDPTGYNTGNAYVDACIVGAVGGFIGGVIVGIGEFVFSEGVLVIPAIATPAVGAIAGCVSGLATVFLTNS